MTQFESRIHRELACAINALVTITIAKEFGLDPAEIALEALLQIDRIEMFDPAGAGRDIITPPMDPVKEYDGEDNLAE